MPEQQFKRNVAYKLRIGDILIGKPVNANVNGAERFAFLEIGNKKIVRANIAGNIIDKYESDGERKYIFLTLDDGSGQIKIKTFGDDCARFKSVFQGQTVVVIGNLRNWNNETYLAPEIIKEQDPRYLLLRKLETEKEKAVASAAMAASGSSFSSQAPSQSETSSAPNQSVQGQKQTQSSQEQKPTSIKDKILDLIKGSEEEGGIETSEILKKFPDVPQTTVNPELQRLLEEGIIFEPRPGKVRYLG